MSEVIMAKKKSGQHGLPSIDGGKRTEIEVRESETTTVTGPQVVYAEVVLHIPYVLQPERVNYQDRQRNRADPGKLTADEMRKLKAIRRGCAVNAETFGHDQEVEKNCHVLRWLLAQIDI